MRDRFLPFAPPCLGEEEIAEVVATLRSGWLTTGPRARRFEEEFAAFVGAPAAVALNSCSAGLHAGLVAAGVGPGDAVVTTPMTFIATANAIEHAGARPVVADVDPETLDLDPACAADAITRATRSGLRVRALLPVHYAGHPCNMDALADLAAAHGLALIEDAAHALPAGIAGRLVGAPVRAGVTSLASFSFYANKNLTTGEGGMLTGPRHAIDRARAFSQQGLAAESGVPIWRRDAIAPGFKYAMSDVAAALGLRQLEKLPAFHARRRELAAHYHDTLRHLPDVVTPVERPGFAHAWHLYVVQVAIERLSIDRDRIVQELAARNIGASVHFRPVHLVTYYRERYGLLPHDLPVTMSAWPHVLSLPLHPSMTNADVDDVVEALADVIRRHRR